jgi:hypothetical protein
VNAQILVSPAEVNAKIIPCATYNMNQIAPANDRYWDTSPTGFKADLTSQSNTSYGVMPLDPTIRRSTEWRNTGNSRFAVLGNRGPRGGTLTGNDYTNSKTLLVHGSTKEWDGNTCYNDNHVDYGRTFYPEAAKPLPQAACAGGPPDLVINNQSQDNLYKNDTGCASSGRRNSDAVLVIQRRSTNTTPGVGAITNNTWDFADQATWD